MAPNKLFTFLRAATWNATFLSNLCTAVFCGLAVWLNHLYGHLIFQTPVYWILALPAGLFGSLPGCYVIYWAGVNGRIPVDYSAAKDKLPA